MKELERIQLASLAQLGSLEDNVPVKRLSITQIKKLRAQAQQQTTLRLSFIRVAVKLWSDVVSAFTVLVQPQKSTYCDRNGHAMFLHGGSYRCRNCNMHSASESVVHID